MTVPDLANRLIFAERILVTRQPQDRNADRFVWACWLGSIAAAIAFLGLTAQDIPLGDDWGLIQPTGGSDFDPWARPLGWQSPLPRMIATTILEMSGGKLRLVAAFNVFALAAVAFAAINVIRLRRGHSRYSDAFIPVTLLHLGHAESFVWASQITQVVGAALAVALILSLVANPHLPGSRGAHQTAAVMVLLSMSGVSGPIIATSMAGWCLTSWWTGRRAHRPNEEPWPGKVLVAASLVALSFSAASLRAGWISRTTVVEAPHSIGTGLAAGALGFGPAVGLAWPAAIFAAGAVLFASCLLGAAAVRRDQRHREPVIGALIVLLSVAVSGVAIGLGSISAGRSEAGAGPPPFLIVTLPGMVAGYILWAFYAPGRIQAAGSYAFFGLTVVLLPFNVAEGLRWREWYVTGMSAVDQGLLAGFPASALARRSQAFLAPDLTQAELAAGLNRLRVEEGAIKRLSAGRSARSVGAARLPESVKGALDTLEIRYRASQAGEVILVWGVSGWTALAEPLRPPNTTIQNGVMSSPMGRSGEEFSVSLQVPIAVSVEYGFWTSKHQDGTPAGIWDGDYRAVADAQVVRVVAPGRIEAQLQGSAGGDLAPAGARKPAPRPQAILQQRLVAAALIIFGLALLEFLIPIVATPRESKPSTALPRGSVLR